MNAAELEPDKIRGIIEALLMTAGQPITPGRLLGLLKGLNGKDLRQAVDDLNERYRLGGHAMAIVEVAGGFQLATHQEYGPWVRKFHDRGQVRLSQAALETLAIVAFKQPVGRVDVDSIRGVDSSGGMRTLFEANMVRMVGRSEGVGRPMMFGTTKEFMVHFGLKSLADLPKPKELEELLAEGARKHEDAAAHSAGEKPSEHATDQDIEPGDVEDSESTEISGTGDVEDSGSSGDTGDVEDSLGWDDEIGAVEATDTAVLPPPSEPPPATETGDHGERDGPEGGTPAQSP